MGMGNCVLLMTQLIVECFPPSCPPFNKVNRNQTSTLSDSCYLKICPWKENMIIKTNHLLSVTALDQNSVLYEKGQQAYYTTDRPLRTTEMTFQSCARRSFRVLTQHPEFANTCSFVLTVFCGRTQHFLPRHVCRVRCPDNLIPLSRSLRCPKFLYNILWSVVHAKRLSMAMCTSLHTTA